MSVFDQNTFIYVHYGTKMTIFSKNHSFSELKKKIQTSFSEFEKIDWNQYFLEISCVLDRTKVSIGDDETLILIMKQLTATHLTVEIHAFPQLSYKGNEKQQGLTPQSNVISNTSPPYLLFPFLESISHNSVISTTRETVQKLLHFLNHIENPVFFNGEEIKASKKDSLLSSDTLYDKIVGDPSFSSVSDILSFLRIPQRSAVYEEEEEEYRKIHELFQKVKTVSETTLQSSLSFQKLLHFFHMIDVSAKPSIFNLPSVDPASISRNDQSYERKGKPDAISIYGPLYLEIKGQTFPHLSGVIQGLERVVVSKHCYNLFGKHLCFLFYQNIIL